MPFIISTENLSWVSSKQNYILFSSSAYLSLCSIVVEFAKESRPRRDVYEGERNHGYDGRNRLRGY